MLGILGEASFRATKAVLSGSSQQMSKHGEVFAKNIYGGNVPDMVRPLFNEDGFSKVQVDTFTRAMDAEPGVRGNLQTLINRAGEGNPEAFDVLTKAHQDFSVHDMRTRTVSKSQTNLGNTQMKKFNQQMGAIDDARNPAVTEAKGRSAKNKVQTMFGAGSEYTSGTKYLRDGKMITNRHHAIGLDDANNVWQWHSSGADVTPNNPSPILKAREDLMGIKSGNYEQNMVDVLDSITKPSRTARIEQVSEQAGGLLESKTLDDTFGMTDYNPRTLDTKTGKGNEGLEAAGLETQHFEQLRQQDPTLTVERYMAENKSPITGHKYAQGSFPNIRVFKPGSEGKVLLDTVTIKNAADHKNRLNLVFDVLDKHGHNTAAARKNVNLSKLQIDPKLDIYGADHPITHQIINALKKKKGTALNEIQTLGPEGVAGLSLDEAIKLDIRSMQEMETVLANVLQFRYKQVVKLYKELNPKGTGPLGSTFEELDGAAKRRFFEQNINTIAVKGNLEKAMNLNTAMKQIKKWDHGIEDTFGWRPQSLFVTVEQIEEIGKELAAKI